VDVSRIITGKLNLRFDPVDFRDVVESAVDVVRSAAQAKSIRLRVDVPRKACLVNGDRDRLQQVIWNLLSNAIKFTHHGGAVSLTLRDEDGAFVLEVSDTGIGIPPSFLPHVFERFRQADGSTTREHGGLGLGLAIVKELTEMHGGEVAVRSGGVGQGATFVVRLPQLAGLDLPSRREFRGSRVAQAELQGIQILAVDDNLDSLDVLATSLATRGAHVRVVATGQEAIREWDRQPPDVLLCDLAMPQMNGFDLLNAIRERDRAAGRITPAIALTAHTSEEYQAKTRAAGFEFHVAKPYDVAQLVRTVLTALERV
jgi:CheY-like chemotaxis protein/two-component sensor histidine kinase